MHVLRNNPAFLRLLSGRLITNAGDSLYYIAAMWLVYDLSGSTFFTGLAGALTLAPQAFQFVAGPLVDRWSLRRILVRTQLIQCLLVLVIPIAAWTGHLSVGIILVVMPLLSILNQFVYPAQNAALPRIVEDENLVEANSAFSFAYQGVDTVFMALGGLLVALIGAIALFVVDAVTFAVAAIVFMSVRIPTLESETETVESTVEDYFSKLSDGIVYVRGSVLVPMMAGSVVVNFAVGVTMAVLPAYADVHGGAGAYGFLFASITGGMLVGALAASPLKRFSIARLCIVGFAFAGICWLAAVSAPSLSATAALFALALIPVGVTNVVSAAMVQTIVPDDLLGRITSINVSASVAATPLGSLLGGLAGDIYGSTLVVAAAGVGFLFLTGYWATHPVLRKVPSIEQIDPERFGLVLPSN